MTSYPIYILDLTKEPTIVFPENKVDINHTDFWEETVAKLVATHFRLPLKKLLNIPYCQRRARICNSVIYYGEQTTKKLLQQIEEAVGETGLRFEYDDHEKRLKYDVLTFLNQS